MNFFKKISPKFVAFLIIVYLSFTLIGCPPKSAKKILEETTPKETVEESEEEVEEIVVEESPEEEKDLLKEEFLESIKDYEITFKAIEYAEVNLKICMDRIDIETETFLLTNDEVASRYLELASQIRKDSFGLKIILKSNNKEEEKIIELIDTWFYKMKKSYEYLAKYYWGDGAIYEIKSDELKEEADKIYDEYNKAIKEYKEK
ncbi:unnamed protein product [marine sediment metagenome]|uniref:Uncharacterized protein n=1 Tax=marine sediment metagenome TaxID=412755 RepID=X1M0I4_9ZZZZ